jgi:peroxiredoxin
MRKFLLAAAALSFALPAAAALKPGQKAPDFTTRGALAGKIFTVKLSQQLKKGPVVLYFFPAAYTAGCNAEAKAFAEAVPEFRAAGATVIGMSADSVDRLVPFSNEHCAGKFPVASAGPKVIAGYDVLLDRKIPGPDGKPRTVTNRTSFVIAPDGKILYAHSDLSPADHVKNTLASVRAYTSAH